MKLLGLADEAATCADKGRDAIRGAKNAGKVVQAGLAHADDANKLIGRCAHARNAFKLSKPYHKLLRNAQDRYKQLLKVFDNLGIDPDDIKICTKEGKEGMMVPSGTYSGDWRILSSQWTQSTTL